MTHDFVDTSGMIFLRPGQTIKLTLLMEPHSSVNATCGEIGAVGSSAEAPS